MMVGLVGARDDNSVGNGERAEQLSRHGVLFFEMAALQCVYVLSDAPTTMESIWN